MTLEKSEIQVRKSDHLRICLENDVQFQTTTTGLEKYRFSHVCLPEIDRQNIDISTIFLGKKLQVPLLISSMTGGTDFAQEINYRLAEVAEYYQLAMGVGSQRIAVENPAVANTFAVRKIAPNIPLFANLGAVQLNYGYTISQCEKSIDLLEADALILHFNPLQEAIQTAGNTNFADLLGKIEQLCKCLPVPVIAKEVGNGISGKMALQLIGAGVKAIDVAGAGGTSWAKIEGERASHPLQKHLGETFTNWGLPTAECLIDLRRVAPQIPLIASGGLRNGLDVAKAIALGADLAGLAWPFLQVAAESQEALHHLVEILIAEITTVLFCTGQINLSQLQQSEVLEKIS